MTEVRVMGGHWPDAEPDEGWDYERNPVILQYDPAVGMIDVSLDDPKFADYGGKPLVAIPVAGLLGLLAQSEVERGGNWHPLGRE